ARITLRHWFKFNTVGVIGIFVQLGMLAALKAIFHMHYLVATALAVETAVLHNFMWHHRWTWIDRKNVNPAGVLLRLLRFNLTTGALSILGNLVLMRLWVGQLRLHYLVANLLTIAICSLLNFLVSERCVFR